MPREQRSETLTVNFDSLTDTITNLAGALVLVVVLVLAMSRESPTAYRVLPPPDNPGDEPVEPLLMQLEITRASIRQTTARVQAMEAGLEQLEPRVRGLLKEDTPVPPTRMVAIPLPSSMIAAVLGGNTSTTSRRGSSARSRCGGVIPLPLRCGAVLAATLIAETSTKPSPSGPAGGAAAQRLSETQRLVGLLDASIQQTDEELAQLSARTSRLRQQMQQLYDKVRSIRLPEQKKETTEGEKPVRKLKYRPPMEQFTTRSTLVFICEEGTVSFIDFGPALRRVRKIKQQGAVPKEGKALLVDPPEGDFQIRISFLRRGGNAGPVPGFLAIRKPGHPGESWDQAKLGQSRFRRVLKNHSASDCYLGFFVRPDSYEVFRQARQAGWDKHFEVGWVPREVGEPLRFERGAVGRIQR